MHKTRSARRANVARRKAARHKQRPVPPETQREVAARRAAEHLSRYPVPPLYRVDYDHAKPTQPSCYPTRYRN